MDLQQRIFLAEYIHMYILFVKYHLLLVTYCCNLERIFIIAELLLQYTVTANLMLLQLHFVYEDIHHEGEGIAQMIEEQLQSIIHKYFHCAHSNGRSLRQNAHNKQLESMFRLRQEVL